MQVILSALSLCLLLCANAIGRDDHAQLVDLRQQIARLESNAERAEAIRAMKRLQYTYGHYAEFGLWNDLADLFAENGIGRYPVDDLGKEGIRKLFLQDVGKGKLGLPDGMLYPHVMLQPVVTLEPAADSFRYRNVRLKTPILVIPVTAPFQMNRHTDHGNRISLLVAKENAPFSSRHV